MAEKENSIEKKDITDSEKIIKIDSIIDKEISRIENLETAEVESGLGKKNRDYYTPVCREDIAIADALRWFRNKKGEL